MNAVLVKNFFEIASEARTLQRFGEEVFFERFVLQVFAYISEALLAVEKCADEFVECQLHLVLFACVCRHRKTSILFILCIGWSRVHRLRAILLRRRQAGEIAKIPRPCQPVLRSAEKWPGGEY